MCWDKTYADRINDEIGNKHMLPEGSPLRAVLDFLERYQHAIDKRQYLDGLTGSQAGSVYVQRLAAYFVSREGYHEQAAEMFDRISAKERLDLLMMAAELIKAGKYRDIEKILHRTIKKDLHDSSRRGWDKAGNEMTAIEKAIIYTLLDATHKNKGLKLFDVSILVALEEEINGVYDVPLQNGYLEAMCS